MRRLLAVALLAFFATTVQAQITNVNDTTSTPIPGAGHDYIHMLSETVNPANGSVSLRIEVPTPKGRGISLPFSFAYDSNGVQSVTALDPGSTTWQTNLSYLAQGGWSYSVPLLNVYNWTTSVQAVPQGNPGSCTFSSNYVFQDAKGGRHDLGLGSASYESNTLNTLCGSPVVNGGDPQVTAALLTGATAGNSNPTTTVADADGTVYYFANTLAEAVGKGHSSLPTFIEDRNGNQVTAGGSLNGVFTFTDTAGRTVFSSNGFGPSGTTNSITVGGLTYQVAWTSATASYTVTSKQINAPAADLGITCSPIPPVSAATPGVSATQPVVSSITLPNGEAYKFSYNDPYGLISEIQYPNGGSVSYTWKLSDTLSELAIFDGQSCSDNPSGQPICVAQHNVCQYQYNVPVVATRTVTYATSASPALTQSFTYSTAWGTGILGAGTVWNSKTTAVATTDDVLAKSFTTNYTYASVPAANEPYESSLIASQIPVESTIQYNDFGGALLRTVTKTWLNQFEMATQLTTLDNGAVSEVAYSYGPGDQITEKDEYDYGSGAPGLLFRKTVYNYQTFPSTPVPPANCPLCPYTAGSTILDRPSSVITYNDLNNTLTRVAETDYAYDQFAVASASATEHDANYSTTATIPRANPTTVTKQCFPSCTNAVSVYTYDQTGQILTFKDPNGNTTSYSYLDSYFEGSTPPSNTNAYLTQIKRPTASNGVSHVSNYEYLYPSGQLVTVEDENSQFTHYVYDDPLLRLTQTEDAAGGLTMISYNDAPPSPTVTTSKLISVSLARTGTVDHDLTSVAVMDGIGHTVTKELTTDPTGPDYTATTYDGSGNVHTVTNPYRSTGETTYGITTTLYDALNRRTLVTKPDGSKTTTVYSGNCTTVTDEAGKTRQSCTDGLGRVTEVTENPGGLNYTTEYSWNVLDDLTSVVQNGDAPRVRKFIYDSLGRLTSSLNPETGVTPVLYAYDANGNVLTKKDARGITITYTWDALNRMNQRTYSNGDHYVGYGYDSATCVVVTTCYNIGHMTSMTDAAGTESWAYDLVGRMSGDQRTTAGITKNTAYTYNRDGTLATLTYPSGHTVTYTMSGADLPLTAADSTVATYASSGVYTPWGALSSASLGSNIDENIVYNTRLQPCWTYASTSALTATSCTGSETSSGNLMDVQYNFNLGADNGNLRGITNNRNSNRSQSYVYDAVNRITSAATVSTCTASCWTLTFTLDQFANLTAVAGTGNATLTPNANNQIGVAPFTYDASGNELTDVTSTYAWNAESEMKSGGGVTYLYDGRGNRVEKSGTKLYWYGPNGQVLDETDTTGSTANTAFSEYVYFAGARVARRDYLNNVYYYFEDQVNSSRVIAELPAGSTTPTLCYDADFYPYGGEKDFTNTCAQNYKFDGKERDPETGNDYFGARYYSSAYGRFLSPDWSSVPAPVPYADLTNPQTLNLYAFVSDNPESFADLNGHDPNCAAHQPADCPTVTPPHNNSNQDKKQIAKGVGQITAGVVVGVGVALAPESAGTSVVAAGVLLSSGLLVKGTADVAVGATGGGDTSEMKDAMDMAQNPVALTVAVANGGNVKQANDVGSVVGGISAVKDLAEHPTSAVGFLMAAKDAFEGARASVSLAVGALSNITTPTSVRSLLPTNY